jgi:hypothetical protein
MTDVTQRILAVVLTAGLIILILELVRRRRLMERYALLWLFSAALLLVLAAWKGLLTTISLKVGIHYPPSLLFAAAFAAELLLLLHFSLAISSLTDQSKILAQRVALLQNRLEAQEQRLAALDSETDVAPSPDGEGASRAELSRSG